MNDNSRCYFHPDEVVVGVCRLCLNERLLVLAAKQKQGGGGHHLPRYDPTARSGYYRPQGQGSSFDNKKQQQRTASAAATVPKIFALGSFFNRLEFRHWKPDAVNSYHDASSSPEDSFISIRFENNGLGSWEKNAVSKVSSENCKATWNQGLSRSAAKERDIADKEHCRQHGAQGSGRETKTVIEHPKPRASLRWRRIGHLFHLIRWKRSTKGNVCHVDGVKVRNGWLRTLIRRRTKE